MSFLGAFYRPGFGSPCQWTTIILVEGNAALKCCFYRVLSISHVQTTRIASVSHVGTLPSIISLLLETPVSMLQSLTITSHCLARTSSRELIAIRWERVNRSLIELYLCFTSRWPIFAEPQTLENHWNFGSWN
jgi:hypothetical protein